MSNIKIERIQKSDLLIVKELAEKIWPVCYASILSEEQIAYMLMKMYSILALENSYENGQTYHLYSLEDYPIGFSSVQINYPLNQFLRLHKLYLIPSVQKQGLGRKMIKFLMEFAKDNDMNYLHLNVNRYNPALHFYQSMGFGILHPENIDIGNGFLMEDFVMQLKIDKYQR
jgi:GNAT superfamily N-acetyltransferase